MIGGECEAKVSYHNDGKIGVWNKDKSDFWFFNKSDVRFLTPIKFKDRHIAIGDWVKIKQFEGWYEVVNFAQTNEKEKLLVNDDDIVGFVEEHEIQDHDPGIETDEYIEIDGEKWSKSTIKEALKNKLNL